MVKAAYYHLLQMVKTASTRINIILWLDNQITQICSTFFL